MKNFKQYLQEKLILFNNGANYGQVVFLAGGGGSGKGFSRDAFMESDKFKIRDVDEWKLSFLKLAKTKDKYPEIRDLNLRNPDDVFKLHEFVKKNKIKDKSLDLLLKNTNPDRLPNIMFDVTLKDIGDIEEVMPMLLQAGYKKENIHITWILTDYHLAVKANKTRSRVVPDDILLKTHEGAAETMHSILNGNVPDGVDGDIKVVLNNHDQTLRFGESANVHEKHKGKGTADFNIGGFTYLTVKRSGKPIATGKSIKEKLFNWIKSNVPESSNLGKLMTAGQNFLDGQKKGMMDAGVPLEQPRQMAAQEFDNDNDRSDSNRDGFNGNSQGGSMQSQGQQNSGGKNSGLVTIHRRHGGRIGFAFKTQGKKIGFTPQEAEEKIKNLKKLFPGDEFVTIEYNPRKFQNNR